ncbi:MAG: hypothetical protein JWP66_1208, partial [Naasia sp.]|nr:hypothetical protein [Naasia sp.]
IQKALDELEGEEIDVTGESFTPMEVQLKAGGEL